MSFDKTILVVDSGNHCVERFDFSINFLAVFGSRESVLLEFQNPQRIIVEENSSEILVADSNYPCVQVIDLQLTFCHS